MAREALPLGWANALMRSAWPAYIEAKMASVASRSAQRALDELVSEQPRASAVEGVYLESLTWGTRPPSMGHAAVEWDERGALSGGSVRFEFDACFHAPDFCAQVAVRVLLLGGTTARVRLSELEIEGRVVVQVGDEGRAPLVWLTHARSLSLFFPRNARKLCCRALTSDRAGARSISSVLAPTLQAWRASTCRSCGVPP